MSKYKTDMHGINRINMAAISASKYIQFFNSMFSKHYTLQNRTLRTPLMKLFFCTFDVSIYSRTVRFV